MKEREKTALRLAGVLAVGITLYSAWKLIGAGVLSWHISQKDYHFMMLEVLCLWLVLFLIFSRGKNTMQVWGAVGVVTAVFSWIHMIFLPILFTGCYMAYLILLGKRIGGRQSRPGVSWQFFLGAAGTILVFCLLSLVRLGSIRKLRMWVLVSGVVLLFSEIRKREKKERSAWKLSPASAAMAAAILALLFLQAGRLNISVDFDSLWYGVRSHIMLDSGHGIYENLKTLGVAYTYPKGWEALTLPMAGLPSHSFTTAMNLWVSGLTLLVLYDIAAVYMDREKALWVPFLAASVPGIMNMSGTAKADMMTLFCQLLMVQAVVMYEKEKNREWLVMGAAAGCVSLAMKPTAVVFSTAVGGVAFCWLCVRRFWTFGQGKKVRVRVWMFLALAVGVLGGIWGRTLHLVGVPVTSIFYQVLQKMGFQVKYPFYAAGFPAAGSGMTAQEQWRFLAGRLYGILLNPQGDDMAHVIIAWGGVLPLVFFVFLLCLLACRRKEEKIGKGFSFLVLLLAALLFIDLVSLHSLLQIDGNYYMLTYGLMILAGCIWLEHHSGRYWKWTAGVLWPVWFYGVLLCGLTNWAWALGNGGIHLAHKGYYSHTEAEKEARAAWGSAAIWDILAASPETRVIAIGEHPGVLSFPCWVQSYLDVSGYWGNPEVVANAPNFLKYLKYADVDYLYMEKGYVDTSVRIYQIIRTLIREGWLYDVRDENGNLIISVDRESTERPAEEKEQNLFVFDNRYIQHP